MLLQHEDLELLNSYTQNLSRLMFRSFFGCGVICGLAVKTESKCGKLFISVESGVALTCLGDPVWVPEKIEFAPSDNCDTDLGDQLWVVLCRTLKCCGPRTSVCESGDEEGAAVCTREVEGYEIRVETSRKCFCGCPDDDSTIDTRFESECKCVDPDSPCYADHYKGICGCSCGDCSDCDCNCIILARLDNKPDAAGADNWSVDHGVRRFVRPVLMRDPLAERPKTARAEDDKALKVYKTTGQDALTPAKTGRKTKPAAVEADPN
jgi:hypothetical protein